MILNAIVQHYNSDTFDNEGKFSIAMALVLIIISPL